VLKLHHLSSAAHLSLASLQAAVNDVKAKRAAAAQAAAATSA